jgi:hypothetical protein
LIALKINFLDARFSPVSYKHTVENAIVCHRAAAARSHMAPGYVGVHLTDHVLNRPEINKMSQKTIEQGRCTISASLLGMGAQIT